MQKCVLSNVAKNINYGKVKEKDQVLPQMKVLRSVTQRKETLDRVNVFFYVF